MILLATTSIILLILILRVYNLIIKEQLTNETVSTNTNNNTATGYLFSKEIKVFQFVKKFNLKSIFIFLFVSMFLISNISAHKSIWTSSTASLSLEEKQNSIIFQNLRGSNCINEFVTLTPILNRAGEMNFNFTDITNLLGQPDEILENGDLLKYKLFPSKIGCSGNVRLSNGKVVAYSIQNCN